jgi:hypothetical protein
VSYNEHRIARLRESLEKDTYEKDEILYWVSNDQVVPLRVFIDAGARAPAGQGEAEEQALAAFAKQYKEARKNYKPSGEQMFEMRAAFGPGETVVDIITGQEFRT